MCRHPAFASLMAVVTWPVLAQSADPQRESGRLEKLRARGAQEFLAPDQPWKLLGDGYQLTADSAVDTEGNVYFTDAQKDRILRIDFEGRISIWKEGTNRTHGVAFGADGRLYGGQHDRKRIVAFARDGTKSVITEGVQTHHLTVTSRNEIYFSEPPAHKVWMVDATGHRRVVHEGIGWPRGVRVSTDRRLLVVSDPRTNWIWRFRILRDGSLGSGGRFCHLETSDGSSGSDAGGMAFDSEGLLYVATTTGVQVCDPRGRLTAIVDPPGSEGLSNVFFGGPGLQWLYITDGNRIYRRPARRSGAVSAATSWNGGRLRYRPGR